MNQKKEIENIIFGRTDLAKDEYDKKPFEELADFENIEKEIYNIQVTKNIIGDKASKIINKPVGTYYTIDLSNLDIHDTKTLDDIEYVLASTLRDLLKEQNLLNKKALIIGLGNFNVTPDAIGPATLDNIVVTRHLDKMNMLSDGFSNVCAMAPGVMGSTGIETYDIVEGLLNKVDVDYLIVIDALATNSIKRINKTIQITDTGIKPGAGIGNKRKELSFKTLNKPVIAIGVPTVVDATTITVDAINIVLKQLYLENNNKTSFANKITTGLVKEDLDKVNNISDKEKNAFFGSFGLLSNYEQKTLIEEILTPQGYNLIVTPKEIDVDVEDLSKIIANGINMALHEGIYNTSKE